MASEEQWLLTHVVARQHQAASTTIPESEGELPTQVFHTVDAVILVQVKDRLDIGSRAEAMAGRLESLA